MTLKATVSMQVRHLDEDLKTVKTVRSGSTGWVSPKIKASKSRYWRVVYSGSAATGSSTARGTT